MVFLVIRLILLFFAMSTYLDLFGQPGLIQGLIQDQGGAHVLQSKLSAREGHQFSGIQTVQYTEDFARLRAQALSTQQPLIIGLINTSLDRVDDDCINKIFHTTLQEEPFKRYLYVIINCQDEQSKSLIQELHRQLNLIIDHNNYPMVMVMKNDRILLPALTGCISLASLKLMIKQRLALQ